MNGSEPIEFEGTDLEPRDVRALTETLLVCGDTPDARGATDLYSVFSSKGREYLVDARQGCCTCPDFERRAPEGGCKHVRRVAYKTGAREVPAWVDREALDDPLREVIETRDRAAAYNQARASIDTDDAPGEAIADGGRESCPECDDCEACAGLDALPCARCAIEHGAPIPGADGV